MQNRNKIKVVLKLTVIFLVIIVLFVLLKSQLVGFTLRYPQSKNCEVFKDESGLKFMLLALMDKKATLDGEGLGFYQCYCEEHSDPAAAFESEDNLCYQYQADFWYKYAATYGLTGLITLINMALRTISARLIQTIGYNTESEERQAIMMAIFVVQYTNTGLLLMLSNASFEHTPLAWFGLSNSFNDFTAEWYSVVGTTLQYTMIVQALMPYFNFCILYGTKFVSRVLDSGCTFWTQYP